MGLFDCFKNRELREPEKAMGRYRSSEYMYWYNAKQYQKYIQDELNTNEYLKYGTNTRILNFDNHLAIEESILIDEFFENVIESMCLDSFNEEFVRKFWIGSYFEYRQREEEFYYSFYNLEFKGFKPKDSLKLVGYDTIKPFYDVRQRLMREFSKTITILGYK